MKTLILIIALFSSIWSVEFQNGDLVFQSLPRGDLIDAIETATRSPFSHCGIVFKDNEEILVLEAIGPVRTVAIDEWIKQGRNNKYLVCRYTKKQDLNKFIQAGKKYMGKPYDIHYTLDEGKIYCSELIYKAAINGLNIQLVDPTKLKDLQWQSILPIIRQIEGDNVPLEREIVTPVSLVYSKHVKVVYSNYNISNGITRR